MKTTLKTQARTVLLFILFGIGSSIQSVAQDINFTFENAQITNDGSNDFYEIDVLISSTSDFKLGSGQLYFNYNTAAFGENIHTSGSLEYLRPDGSILAAQIGSPPFVFNIYRDFIVNDNTTSRVSISFQQNITAQFIPADNVTATPTFLCRLRVLFQDSGADPMFCFEDQSPFDNQFFTACANDGSDASPDCTNFPGTQIINDTFNCSLTGPTCVAVTTFTSGVWDNGAPDNSTQAIITTDYNTNLEGASIDACLVTIAPSATVTITDGFYLLSEEDIIVNGTLMVEHQGSVVQVSESALTQNNGSITVSKTTPVLTPTDFMILGSPVSLETREGVYGTGRRVLNHITENFVPHPGVESLAPGTANWADDNGDNWSIHTGLIHPGEGYFVRPQPDQDTGGSFNLDYTQGTLNSGVVNFDMIYNGSQNASPNIVGNPYASAIDADVFIAANSMVDVVYFWEHVTAPSNTYPGYQPNNFDMGDISQYNSGSGGVAAANGGDIPTQWIASGQGFGVKASAAGTALFSNAMRVTGPNDNYRMNENRDRIWLDLSNEAYGLKSNMLIAFSEGASDDFESFYDARRLATPVSLYSILEDETELAIQGRTSFMEEQRVHLGFSTMVEEEQTYTISIREVEGDLIASANVYLEDLFLNTWVNLLEEDYIFHSNNGDFKDRFVISFQEPEVLGADAYLLESVILYPNPAQDLVHIANPQLASLLKITFYDITGRVIKSVDLTTMNSNKEIDISSLAAASYIAVIDSSNGKIVEHLIKK